MKTYKSKNNINTENKLFINFWKSKYLLKKDICPYIATVGHLGHPLMLEVILPKKPKSKNDKKYGNFPQKIKLFSRIVLFML